MVEKVVGKDLGVRAGARELLGNLRKEGAHLLT
jgi:hypothetical protein